MKNVNNTTDENYGNCVHSNIYTAEKSDFIYRKAYIGDWGDWDEQPDNNITTDQGNYELEEMN